MRVKKTEDEGRSAVFDLTSSDFDPVYFRAYSLNDKGSEQRKHPLHFEPISVSASVTCANRLGSDSFNFMTIGLKDDNMLQWRN